MELLIISTVHFHYERRKKIENLPHLPYFFPEKEAFNLFRDRTSSSISFVIELVQPVRSFGIVKRSFGTDGWNIESNYQIPLKEDTANYIYYIYVIDFGTT